jgi:hypothetical protein
LVFIAFHQVAAVAAVARVGSDYFLPITSHSAPLTRFPFSSPLDTLYRITLTPLLTFCSPLPLYPVLHSETRDPSSALFAHRPI